MVAALGLDTRSGHWEPPALRLPSLSFPSASATHALTRPTGDVSPAQWPSVLGTPRAVPERPALPFVLPRELIRLCRACLLGRLDVHPGLRIPRLGLDGAQECTSSGVLVVGETPPHAACHTRAAFGCRNPPTLASPAFRVCVFVCYCIRCGLTVPCCYARCVSSQCLVLYVSVC